MNLSSTGDVRSHIDQIDSELVKMIALRSQCVKAAAAFKTDLSAVRAPGRVQQVIDKISNQATGQDFPQ